MDESSHNNKVKLEFHVCYLSETGERLVRYLKTTELELDVDLVNDFLLNDKIKSLSDLKIMDGEKVFHETLHVLKDFRLDISNMVHLMTDNCATMKGCRSGAAARIKELAFNMIDFPGCACHNVHLLCNELVKSDSVLKMLQKFVELFSEFLNSTPKARCIFKQSSIALGTKCVYSFSPTRFLDLFRVMENLLDQFPLVCKLIKLSPSLELKAIAGNPFLLIHIDQFVIHHKPMYNLTTEFQTTDLDVYGTLSMLLCFLAKTSFRLGHSLVLLPQKYYSKLYDEDDVPIRMKSQNTDLFYSETHRHVEQKLHETSESDVKNVQAVWDNFNENLFFKLLTRFHPFLKSPIVRGCHVFYSKLKDVSNSSKKKFSELAKAYKLPSMTVIDELCEVQSQHPEETLLSLFKEKRSSLNSFNNLMTIIESYLLVVTNNMDVERGFSIMKTSETEIQSRMGIVMYDSVRFVRDRFDRNHFEEFVPPQCLLDKIKAAGSKYKTETREAAAENLVRSTARSEVRESLNVFKRHTSKELERNLNEVSKQLDEAKKKMNELEEKKRRLESENSCVSSRAMTVSQNIIDSMF